jgi:hypothetical protein
MWPELPCLSLGGVRRAGKKRCYPAGNIQAQLRISSNNNAVPMTETAIEPRQPRRFEKKTNT